MDTNINDDSKREETEKGKVIKMEGRKESK